MRLYTKEEVCEYIGSRGALPQDVDMTPEEDFDSWVEHMKAGDYEIGREIDTLSMRPVKVVLTEPLDQGPGEYELGPFNQGVVIDHGALIDVASSDVIGRVDSDGDWQVNLPAVEGSVMPIAFYRRMFVQVVGR